MLTLIDCNNFFVSCERLFRPDLAKRPVVVLSSNDGCIISRSEEAKALGLRMGEPYFKVKELCEKKGVAVFSSNFDLYRDLSRRVMETLRRFSDEVEVYSVDEAFLTLELGRHCERNETERSNPRAWPHTLNNPWIAASSPCGAPPRNDEIHGVRYHVFEWGREIRETVLHEVGIPVSVGIAPTKTLAKVATHYAKHAPRAYGNTYTNGEGRNSHESPIRILHTGMPGVCVLIEELARTRALDLLPIEEVWGIGFRLAPKLKALGIDTAGKLAAMDDRWIQKHMSIKGLTTVHELRGTKCYDVGEDTTLRKSLLHSQSFGASLYAYKDVRAAVAYHARKVAETLRTEKAAARSVSVMIRTSRHREKRYAAFDTDTLPVHTNSTFEIVSQALAVFDRLYRPGFPYAKAGVQVSDIVPEGAVHPTTLFGDATAENKPLMDTLDTLRQRFGPDIVRMGAEGKGKKWSARHKLLSPRYTSVWLEIPKVSTQ